MDSPASIQPAFKLLNFVVTKVNLSVDSQFNDEDLRKLQISLSSGLGFSEENLKVFSVSYKVLIESEDKKLTIDIEAVAIFESKEELTEESKKSPLLKANAPAIGFPFVRSFINTLTTNAGLPSVILPTFNFLNPDK